MIENKNKKHTSQNLTQEERAERRKYNKQMRETLRTKRIKEAKQILLAKDESSEHIAWASNILREKELVERIDTDKQELKIVRAKLKELHKQKRANRNDRPRPVASEKDRAKRVSQHKLKTFALINRIIEELVGKGGSEVFDLLPQEQALILSEISYGQIADLLNDQEHKTLYGKKWSRASVKRLLELHGGKKYKGIGHVKKKTSAATQKRTSATLEFARKMDEGILQMIDCTATHYEIAQELNKRGIKTRTGNKWINSAVSRLFISIEKLKKE